MKKFLALALASLIATATIAAPASAGYGYFKHHHHFKKVKVKKGLGGGHHNGVGAYLGGAMLCSTAFLMIDSRIVWARSHRELTPHEAHWIIANCFLPIVGGLLVDAAYNNNGGN